MKKYLGILCILAMMLAAACSSSTGEDGGESDGAATDVGATDAGGSADTTASQDAGAVDPPASYTWVVIFDDTKTCTGTGPGADIDAIAVYRGGKLIGVGKPGTADYAKSAVAGCETNGHAKAADVEACTGPLGDIDPKEISTGYLSLGAGSVQLQVGGCANGDTDVHKCDGKGDAIKFQDGDEIDVYEVDKYYQETENPLTKAKYITGQCKCDSEPYTIILRKAKGGTPEDLEVGSVTGTAIENPALKVKFKK